MIRGYQASRGPYYKSLPFISEQTLLRGMTGSHRGKTVADAEQMEQQKLPRRTAPRRAFRRASAGVWESAAPQLRPSGSSHPVGSRRAEERNRKRCGRAARAHLRGSCVIWNDATTLNAKQSDGIVISTRFSELLVNKSGNVY